MPLTFTMFGPLQAQRDGVALDLGRPQQRAVLAMLLAASGEDVPVSAIVRGVWGDAVLVGPQLSALRTHVYRLRRALDCGDGVSVIVTTAAGYRVDVPGEDIDLVDVAGRIAEALRMARIDPERGGGLLASGLDDVPGEAVLVGVPGPAAARIRQRFHDLRLDAWEARLQLWYRAARHFEVLAHAPGLAARYPYRERFAAFQVRSLLAVGRRADALDAYAAAASRLLHEHGLTPGPELAALLAEIWSDASSGSAALEYLPR